MARLIAAVTGGILLGIIAMLVVARFSPSNIDTPNEIVRDIADVPKMSPAVAEKHRDEQYANLVSIQDVMSLPTAFSRSEALFVLAGRSDSAGVQNLIFDANRIADEVERHDLLEVLFFRLAETDPQSALALARTDNYKSIRSIEQVVWRTWARESFADALFAAKTQVTLAQQNSAAQSLYAAFGYWGNETTDLIKAELGIAPDRTTRSRYLYKLADHSPAEAIAFINELEFGRQQQEYISWLAYYIGLKDPTAALGYANLFEVDTNRQRYSNTINNMIARDNPRATIERILASGRNTRSSSEYHNAVRELASTDLDAVLQYFEQAISSDDRRVLGSVIARELVKTDPAEALRWSRANDKEQFPYLQMSVLGQIAATDPQLALTEALSITNIGVRSSMVGNVLQQVVQHSPADAVVLLEQIHDKQQRLMASQQLASAWIQEDPDAAIEWILSQDEKVSQQVIQQAGETLLRSDIDAAIRFLPRVDEQNQQIMRQQIAHQLATIRSPGEAQSFIQQFEGQPGYDQLQASLISGIARTDVVMAKQLADQLADSNARDTAYVQVIAQRAETNPVEASRWLGSVGDERLRGAAAGKLASKWYAHDPVAAEHWVSNLPAGSARDDAIMHISSQWGDPTAGQKDLIASIEDRDKRGQAKLRQVYQIMRTDPDKARELLEDDDIPSYQRQQVETMINQRGMRY